MKKGREFYVKCKKEYTYSSERVIKEGEVLRAFQEGDLPVFSLPDLPDLGGRFNLRLLIPLRDTSFEEIDPYLENVEELLKKDD